jgi:hypothetical protein
MSLRFPFYGQEALSPEESWSDALLFAPASRFAPPAFSALPSGYPEGHPVGPFPKCHRGTLKWHFGQIAPLSIWWN